MSPTPTPSPSPVFKEDEGWNVNSTLHDALVQQQHITADLNSSSTLTPAQATAFDQLMDGHPTHSAAPIVTGIVLSVLVLVTGAVAFVRNRRAHGTSPAPATAEV